MSRKKIKINIKPKDNSKKPVNNPPEKDKQPRPVPQPEKKENLSEEQRRAKERDQQILEERARLKRQQEAKKEKETPKKETSAPQKSEAKTTEKKPKSSRRKTRNSQRKSLKAAKATKAKARQAQVSTLAKYAVRGLLFLLVIVGAYYFFKLTSGENTEPIVEEKDPITPDFIPEIEEGEQKFFKYGLDTRKYKLNTEVPLDDIDLVDVLGTNRIDRSSIGEIQIAARQKLRPLQFKARHKYTVFEDKDTRTPSYIVYEASPLKYFKFGLADSIFVEVVERETVTTRKSFGTTLATTLDEAFYKKSIDNKLAHDLDDALASTVDLFRIKPGSEFKIHYDETFADGDKVGSKLIAAYIKSDNRDYYAFWYEDGGISGYFDERARPTKRSFLKSPLEFGRVTSKYGSRTHPVTGIVKTHKGTDFAAPSGTPIRALADGEITIAQFKKNNGNYVKIKHSDTYDTQYLHMLSFAEGIVPGAKVRQGQTIGLVGSTGLSTGPHVCLRFWKNNQQIDFLNADLPANQPIAPNLARVFATRKDSLKLILDELQAL